MTNYDRIRSISVERMAVTLARNCYASDHCELCPFDGKGKCPGSVTKSWLKWLLSEVEE